MTGTWPAKTLAAAVLAVLALAPAGCGMRLASGGTHAASAAPAAAPASPAAVATPPAAPSTVAAAPLTAPPSPAPYAPSAPDAPSAPSPAPSVAPAPEPSTAPSLTPSAAPPLAPANPAAAAVTAAEVAAATQEVAAAGRVRRALPTFDQLAADLVARSGVPGAAVAVIAGDGVVYQRCFGLRRTGSPDPVDADTVFQLGGVSQAYTSAMLAALAGDGEIGWDVPVRRVWPGFRLRDPWATREATFRDLTSQRSGLPAEAGVELLAFGYSRPQLLRRLRYLEPQEGFRAGYAPQDALVTAAATGAEKATGDPWASLVRARVLDVIGAPDTALTYRGLRAAVDRATPHVAIAGSMQPQEPADQSVLAPARGVSASLSQLEPFVRMVLNGGALAGARVAPAGDIAETLTPTTAIASPPGLTAGDGSADAPQAAALGWRTSNFDGRLLAAASGDLAAGSSALVTLVPSDGVAVVVLANAFPEGGSLARALTRTLVDLYVRGAPQTDWLARERAYTSATREAAGRRLPAQPPGRSVPPRSRSVYAGTYANRYYGAVSVRRGAGDGLLVRLGHGEALRYVPWSGDTWREPGSGTAAVFKVRGGRALGLRLTLLAFGGRDGDFARR